MPTTPDRTTVVTLDVPYTALQMPLWTDDLWMGDIGSSLIPPVDVGYLPEIGYRLQDYQSSISYLHETDIADDSVLNMSVASSVLAFPTYRPKSELLDVPAGDQRVGDTFQRKAIGAGDTWEDALAGDQASFPGQDLDPPTVPLDRIARGPTSHKPNNDIHIRIEVPGTARSHGQVAAVAFCNVPGKRRSQTLPGNGTYQLALFADGTANLYERLTDLSWVRREMGIRWADPAAVFGRSHVISIRSDAKRDPVTGKWTGRAIFFGFSDISSIASALSAGISGNGHLYRIPGPSLANQPTLEPVRIDVRRDVRAAFQVSISKYKTTGKLTCKIRTTPGELFQTDVYPIYVTAFGDIPTYGEDSVSSLAIDLYAVQEDGTSVLCTKLESGNDSRRTWVYSTFTGLAGAQSYYAELTFDASGDGFTAPTVTRLTHFRDAVAATRTPTPLVIPIVSSISISGPGADPTHETATFTAPDLGGVLRAKIGTRSNVPIRCDQYYDAEDPALFSVLFSGRAFLSQFKVKGPKTTGTTYPVKRWGIYRMLCAGEWARMMEKKTTRLFLPSGNDPTDNKSPFLVTTLLRALFREAGLLDSQFELPVSSMRCFTASKEESMVIEPYTDILPLILTIAREYLGAYVVPDLNATNGGGASDVLGCWRVLIPPSPGEDGEYNYLCRFLQGRPAAVTGVRLTTDPLTYPDLAGIPQTFIRKDSLVTEIEPPEGNIVIVDGVADMLGVLATSGLNTRLRSRQTLTNWPAVDKGQEAPLPLPDPTHPDYTNGEPVILYYQNPGLVNEKAINFMARRLFDLGCHARHWRKFEAPLKLIFDASDPLQIRARKLQFGDAVLYQEDDGTMARYFVGSCNIKTGEGQSKNSMAAYELFSIPALHPEWTEGADAQHVGVMGRETGNMGGGV